MYSPGIPVLGSNNKWHPASALYKTKEPGKATDEISRLASLDRLHTQGYKRFAVAVWRSALSNQEGEYWVGIQFYASAGFEFLDYHFTDEIWYHNAWKKAVAQECRSR